MTVAVLSRAGSGAEWDYAAHALFDSVLELEPYAYWPLGTDPGGVGGTLTDRSGNGRHGTWAGTAPTVGVAALLPRASLAADLDGTSSTGAWASVAAAKIPAAALASDVTLMMLIDADANNQPGIATNPVGSFTTLTAALSQANALAGGSTGIGMDRWVATAAKRAVITYPTLGTPHLWIGTYDSVGGNALLYRDGVLVSCASGFTTGAQADNGGFVIGQGIPVPQTTRFNGRMSDVAIWDRKLSWVEIAGLYRSAQAA